MKFQKLLLLAGLLISLDAAAMMNIGGQTFDIDYSSGEEEEIESPTTSIISKPAPRLTQTPVYTEKPSLPVTTVEPKSTMPTQPPSELVRPPVYYAEDIPSGITPKPYISTADYEKGKRPFYGTSLSEFPPLKPLERPALEPDKPKKLLAPLPEFTLERPAIPDTPAVKKPSLPLSAEPSLAKQPPVYTDKPTVLSTKKEIEPMEKLAPRAPIVTPIKAILPVIVAFKEKHAPAEVTITNNTDDVYSAVYKDQRLDLYPNHDITIKAQLEPLVSPSVSVSTLGERKVSERVSQVAKIILTREKDRKVFDLWVNQIPGKDVSTLTTTVTLMENKIGKPKAEPVRKQVDHKFASAGSSLYFPIAVDLKGKDLSQSVINFKPMEE